MNSWIVIVIGILTAFMAYHFVYKPLQETLNKVGSAADSATDALAKNAVKKSMLDAIGLGSDD
jgi:peptidoglycan/LPS O-acetylase OafA/YrhL